MRGDSDYFDPAGEPPLGLGRTFPARVVVYASDGYTASLAREEGDFLACFTSKAKARKFVKMLQDNHQLPCDLEELVFRTMSFDQARAIAKRFSPMVGLALADDPAEPVIHWVK